MSMRHGSWFEVSMHADMNEYVIEQYKDVIDWPYLKYGKMEFSDDFICRNIDYIDAGKLLGYCSLNDNFYMSHETLMILDMKSKMNMS